MEILLTIVFFFIGFVATIFGESVHFPKIGIIAEMAVIGGVILWRMRGCVRIIKNKTRPADR